MNFRIDYQREDRIGFQEVVFGASKTIDQLTAIVSDFKKNKKNCLITRVQPEKADLLCEQFKPNFYDKTSQMFLIGRWHVRPVSGK